MLFNSYAFLLLFLPGALAAFYLARRISAPAAVWTVGLASLVFYAVWDIRFLPVLIVSILFNYWVGGRLLATESSGAKRGWLTLGLVGDLGALGFFKYSGFILANINALTGMRLPIPAITLPVGISFFTFTQIAFLIDSWRGLKAPNYRFRDYLLFVSFFPHLIAGPILIHKRVIPQFHSPRFGRPGPARLYAAMVFLSLGLFKKVIIADHIAPYVSQLFGHAAGLSFAESWGAALLYSLQLFFDFSAYSEMAVGLALLMNVRIPINFLSPYKAHSIRDFWRRWHISLSLFLRDYLYIPLGGNRRGMARQYANLLVTMLLGGLWHGAGWTFVIWGGLHGAALAINHAWSRRGRALPETAGRVLTFLFVAMAWVVFRSPDLTTARDILTHMLGFSGVAGAGILARPQWLWLAGGLIWVAFAPNVPQLAYARRPRRAMALVCAAAFIIALLNLGKVTEFLYFQF